jgi:predicted phage terminase large subunit-like protein
MFFVEKGTLAHAMGAVLNKEIEKRKPLCPALEPISTTGDKRTKARGIQKVFRTGGIYVDKQAEWYPAFEDELLRFDKGRHDDQVDMLALFGLKLDELIDAPTAEDIEEEEWFEEMGQYQTTTADKITGY